MSASVSSAPGSSSGPEHGQRELLEAGLHPGVEPGAPAGGGLRAARHGAGQVPGEGVGVGGQPEQLGRGERGRHLDLAGGGAGPAELGGERFQVAVPGVQGAAVLGGEAGGGRGCRCGGLAGAPRVWSRAPVSVRAGVRVCSAGSVGLAGAAGSAGVLGAVGSAGAARSIGLAGAAGPICSAGRRARVRGADWVGRSVVSRSQSSGAGLVLVLGDAELLRRVGPVRRARPRRARPRRARPRRARPRRTRPRTSSAP